MIAPPHHDEVEVTLLGPGRGECCLVHVGLGEWLVIDSCVNSRNEPAALAYIDSIGVSPNAVRWVVATHWHDDHIRGFARVVEACTNASVIHSSALENDEFSVLALIGSAAMTKGPSGVSEMRNTWEHLADTSRGSPDLARADFRVFARSTGDSPECEIWALSPSSASLADAVRQFGSLVAVEGQPKRSVPRPKRNPASVVVWVRVGKVVVLLGADLERSSDPDKGWQAVVRSSGRPREAAHVLKVPHHGSEDAHDEGMWSDLVVDEAFAGIAPMVQGSVRLPRDSDRERIRNLTGNAWLTREPQPTRAVKRQRPVDKTIRDVVRRIEKLSIDPGRVTFRVPAANPSGIVVDAPSPALKV